MYFSFKLIENFNKQLRQFMNAYKILNKLLFVEAEVKIAHLVQQKFSSKFLSLPQRLCTNFFLLITHPCCCSSTNADLLPGVVVPPSKYLGVCGASGASIADCGVPGGPSYGLPKSVKFNVFALIDATFSQKLSTHFVSKLYKSFPFFSNFLFFIFFYFFYHRTFC